MADANEEIVGAIGVSVTGDYSSLAASYSSAQDQAATAGEAIADAFNAGVAGVSDAADVVTEALGGIGPAGDDAAGGLNDFAESAGAAGEAVGEAESKLADMAEQLTAVGEALVITEGLTELGSEALSAADGITKASIALANITGSGAAAHETIEGLEQLGMSDGLAMPSLLSAATRMQQILGPSADVVEELGAVANGAAIMGTDIGTAATKFAQMTTTGTASARTLTSLGISLVGLSTALNQVVPGADATADSVAAMFKALDQSQRVDVLNQALASLGGTAQQVAEQTFGGQWQQLANAWEATMAQVGEAILPLISDLLSFAKSDILEPIKDLATAFNSLAPPVKDAAVAVGLVAAAVIPLTGLAAAAGIALAGLGQLTEALGISSGGAAISQAAEAESIAAVGTAAGVASPEVAALGVAEEAAAASGVTANAGFLSASVGVGTLLIGVTAIVAEIGFLIGAYDQMAAAQASAKKTTDDAGASAAALSLKLQGLGADTTQLDLSFAASSITLQQYVDGLMKLVGQYSALHDAQTGAASLDAATVTGMKAVLSSVHDTADAYRTALDVYNQLSSSLQSGVPVLGIQAATAGDVAKAYKDLQSAAEAAGIGLAPIPGSMQAISDMATKMATAVGFTVSAQQESANEQTVAVASLDLATKGYNTSIAALDSYVGALHDAQTANNGSAAGTAAVTTAEQNVQRAYAATQTGLKGLSTTVQDYIGYMNGSGASTQAQIDLLKDLATQFGPATSAALGLDTQIAALQKQLDAPIVGMPNALVGLQSALAETTANVAKFAGEMAQGMAVGVQYDKALNAQLQAQIALNSANAELGTGLQGATDAWSLATIAVAAAQAKLDTLNAAYASNITLAPQVTAAQNALTAAQKNLAAANQSTTTATDANTDAQVKLYGVMGNVAASAQPVVSALNAIGAAAQQDVADLANLGQSVGTIGSQIGQMAGYKEQLTFLATGNFGAGSETLTYVPLPETSYKNAIAAAGAALPAKGSSPQALAQDALAQAQAILQVDQEYFGQTGSNGQPIVSAQDLQTAQQAVTTAQQALATLQGVASGGSTSAAASSTGTSTSSTVSTGSQSPIIVSGTLGGTTSTGTTSTSASTPISTASGGSGTSAIDGGSYPAVTAHQAAGEIWAVDTGATTDAANATSDAAGDTMTAAQQLSSAAGSLLVVASSFPALEGTSLNAVGGGGTAAAGGSALPATGGSGYEGTSLNAVGGGGEAGSGSLFDAQINALALPSGASASSITPLLQTIEGMLTNESIQQVVTYLQGLSAKTTPVWQQWLSQIETIIESAPPGYVATGNPQGAYVPPAASTPIANVPGYNPFGPTSTGGAGNTTVTVSIDARGSMGVSAQQMSAAIVSQVTQQLFTNGARITR